MIGRMAVGHVFPCHRCGGEAGKVRLFAPGEAVPDRGDSDVERLVSRSDNEPADRARLTVVSGIGDISFFVFDLNGVVRALGAADVGDARVARALYAIDAEFVPFWCPRCPASYCSKHWETWDLFDDGFFDEKRGRCPKGHERRLID